MNRILYKIENRLYEQVILTLTEHIAPDIFNVIHSLHEWVIKTQERMINYTVEEKPQIHIDFENDKWTITAECYDNDQIDQEVTFHSRKEIALLLSNLMKNKVRLYDVNCDAIYDRLDPYSD